MTEWLRPRQAAELLHVSPGCVTRYAKKGILDHMYTPANQVLISRQSVEDWMSRRKPISSTVTVIDPR